MGNKKENSNILYTSLVAIILVAVGVSGYLIGKKSNTVSVSDNKIQEELSNSTSNEVSIIAEAGRLGLDINKLKKCSTSDKYISKVNEQMKLGTDTFGITGTPGNVLINNETGEYAVISGAYPKESFIQIIDRLLEKNNTNKENNKDKKDFKLANDKNTYTIISDKRDITGNINVLIDSLKKFPKVSSMKLEQFDFSDNGVKEFLEKNNLKTLPLIIFYTNKVDPNLDKFLIKIKDGVYSLNVGAKFNPFEVSGRGFKVLDTKVYDEIKKNSYISGNKDAKITWLEYSDLQCPFCQRLHNSDVKESLQKKYGNDLNIIFNHFPLGFHEKAMPGAKILECAGEQGGAEDFYKLLDYAYKNKIQK